MLDKLIIFPFNGNAIDALTCIESSYDCIGFVDDDKKQHGKEMAQIKVYSRELLQKNEDAKVLAIPGSPSSFLNRKQLISSLELPVERFATVIHKSAVISPLAKIGHNVLIMAGVVLTSNVVIHNHICILPNSVVHHDSVIHDYCLIGANVTISGHTVIGNNCYLGSGTSVINNIEIGERTLVGIGSNVIRSLPGNSKAAGNPVRLLD